MDPSIDAFIAKTLGVPLSDFLGCTYGALTRPTGPPVPAALLAVNARTDTPGPRATRRVRRRRAAGHPRHRFVRVA